MEATDLFAGAASGERLVLDDGDRYDLLEHVRAEFPHGIFGNCVMDTHLHLEVEGPAEHCLRWFSRAITSYLRAFHRRHGFELWLRGPVRAFPIESLDGLAMAINYAHENPVKANLVVGQVDWPWSSRRAYAGLMAPRHVDVERAREVLSPLCRRYLQETHGLEDAAPRAVPAVSPETLLAAAAQATALLPAHLVGAGRDEDATYGRALYAHLGALESYSQKQLAPLIRRNRQRISQLQAISVRERDIRAARTLIRHPRWRGRLPRIGGKCQSSALSSTKGS